MRALGDVANDPLPTIPSVSRAIRALQSASIGLRLSIFRPGQLNKIPSITAIKATRDMDIMKTPKGVSDQSLLYIQSLTHVQKHTRNRRVYL
jgi:hypothetical protein